MRPFTNVKLILTGTYKVQSNFRSMRPFTNVLTNWTRYNIMWWRLSVTCGWFSPSTPVSSTNKTDHYDIPEILLDVTLNTINLNLIRNNLSFTLIINNSKYLNWKWYSPELIRYKVFLEVCSLHKRTKLNLLLPLIDYCNTFLVWDQFLLIWPTIIQIHKCRCVGYSEQIVFLLVHLIKLIGIN